MLLLALLLLWIGVPPAESVGTQPVKPGEFPAVASLRYPGTEGVGRRRSGKHHCNGVLVAKNVILTAAVCMRHHGGRRDSAIHINRFMREGNDEGRFESFKAQDGAIFHPRFRQDKQSGVTWFNFVLVVLDGESKHQPVEMHKDEKCFQQGSPCGDGVAVGWDFLEPGSRFSLSKELQKVQVPLVPRSECNATYTEIEVTDDMVCAGEVGKDMCSAGAPLFVEGKLAGLVSWGLGCGLEHPGVYANVAHVQEWIEESIEKIKEEKETD